MEYTKFQKKMWRKKMKAFKKWLIIIIICFSFSFIANLVPVELRSLVGYIAGIINGVLICRGDNYGNKN